MSNGTNCNFISNNAKGIQASKNRLKVFEYLKGFVHYIFASLFFMSIRAKKESNCETKGNVFYFTSKVLFALEKIKF